MAVWRWYFEGFKILGVGKNGWPETELVETFWDYEGKNVIQMGHEAPREGKEAIARMNILSATPLGYERVDVKNDQGFVKYNLYHKPHLSLSQDLQKRLAEIKNQILRKIESIPPVYKDDEMYIDSYFGGVREFVPGVVVVTEHHGFRRQRNSPISHEKAEKIIESMRRFYAAVTPDELIILDSDKHELNFEELEAVRRYEENQH